MILEKVGEAIGRAQQKSPITFIIAWIVLLAVTLPGVPLLLDNVEPSLEKVLPQDIDEIRTMNNMRSQFGADMVHIVFEVEPPLHDILNPQVFEYFEQLSLRVVQNEFIFGTQSVLDITPHRIPQSEEMALLLANHPHIHSFVNTDRSLTVFNVQTDTGASAESIQTVLGYIEQELASLEYMNPGLTYSITGFTVIDRATFMVIIMDFIKITGVAFVSMILFLLFYFRNIKKVFISMLYLGLAVMMTLGIVGYTGMTITVVTMVAAAMIMALGISYAVNILYEYYSLPQKNILVQLQSKLIVALLGSSLTTGAGFMALMFGVIPAMKNLGLILALGILITVTIGILLIPVVIYMMDGRRK